ncbi:SDR family oxidoreductase [Gordonia soli]|uniref:Putative oxidoreductase n=1 Tax=Gordonia soli NBRC 108243 TaxID=1223545 RepID=M0QPF4_9ACTN|nr:SDR family oxidoreductase [Gordonia soli]GAC70550.1 putative oxidoreductase [Gordonia soli NBRC 108243]
MVVRQDRPISGSVVVITGAARGIGAATAELFAAQGADVWIGDVDLAEAETTAASIARARAARLDVTDVSSWQDFLGSVLQESGRVDILVNNAGVMPLGPFEDETDEVTDLILDVNVRGVLNGMRAVLPGMLDRGDGRIVNVASMAGMIPIPGMVTYNTSKFAALGASLAARREYAGTGVVVSVVLPSAVRTELASGARLGGGMPTVDPADVAAAIVHIARTGARRVSVPRWVAPGWSAVAAAVPEIVERLARRLIDDRRALTSIDADSRRAYSDRLSRQVAAHHVARIDAGESR